MADSQTDIECGFCFRKNEALEQPKVLSCSHVHCLGCLSAYHDVNQIIQCPLSACRYVLEKNLISCVHVHCLKCLPVFDSISAVQQVDVKLRNRKHYLASYTIEYC